MMMRGTALLAAVLLCSWCLCETVLYRPTRPPRPRTRAPNQDNNRPYTLEDMKELRKQIIKEKLQLFLSTMEPINGTLRVNTEPEAADASLNSPRVTIIPGRPFHPTIGPDTSQSTYIEFSLGGRLMSERMDRLLGAELWLHITLASQHPRCHSSHTLLMQETRLNPGGLPRPSGPVQSITVSREMWASFDLTQQVRQRRMRENILDQNLCIKISQATDDSSNEACVDIEQRRPYLKISFESRTRGRRTRRQTSGASQECGDDGRASRCCLQRFNISFQELGIGIISYPTSYEANFCYGQCGAWRTSNVYWHGFYLSRAATTYGQGHLNPCCSPTKLSPISMMMIDEDGQYRFRESVPNMIVNQCGCE